MGKTISRPNALQTRIAFLKFSSFPLGRALDRIRILRGGGWRSRRRPVWANVPGRPRPWQPAETAAMTNFLWLFALTRSLWPDTRAALHWRPPSLSLGSTSLRVRPVQRDVLIYIDVSDISNISNISDICIYDEISTKIYFRYFDISETYSEISLSYERSCQI